MATHPNAYKQDLEDKSAAAIKAVSELKSAADALAARLEQDYVEPVAPVPTEQPADKPASEPVADAPAGPGVDNKVDVKVK